MSVAKQILKGHSIEGSLKEGEEIAIQIDQTITQDATGTMAYLQFEALGIPSVKTDLSVSYVDHNISETGKQNIEFLQSFADRYNIIFSKPGNGICHQVHLERFAKPGVTILGSDSHTPTGGGIGALAIGAGGLDIAAAMGAYPFFLKMPKVVGIRLKGKLNTWVSAKDVILHLLAKLTVRGGIGSIFEYFGEGVRSLSVPERATITNMGAELGLTSSIFPSDDITKDFLKRQKRENDWKKFNADESQFDEVIEIELDKIEPLIACPSSPDNVKTVREVEGKEVSQVIIGSCTNSSYNDLAIIAMLLKDHAIAKNVKLYVNPGSRQVINTLEHESLMAGIRNKNANVCEPACLGCIGMDQQPQPNSITLRTFNRNFKGRSGTDDDLNYLCSAEVAVASAIYGKITDPRKLGSYPKIKTPDFIVNDDMIIYPKNKSEIIRGEMIAPLPLKGPIKDNISGTVLIKLGNNITTDDIMPAGAKIIPLRSHIPKISDFVFYNIDRDFHINARGRDGGFIVAGENYGQGSSREHAALAPMFLGIKAVIARSFARIHKANLINFGIIPLEFIHEEDYFKLNKNDRIELDNVIGCLRTNKPLEIKDKGITLKFQLSEIDKEIIIAGGKLNYIKYKLKK